MERRMTERRQFDCSLEYDLGATAGTSGVKTYKADAQNICENGLKMVTDYPLAEGMVVRLGLPIDGSRVHLPAFAEVAWAAPASNRFTVGLRFLR